MTPENIKVGKLLCKLFPEFKEAFDAGRVESIRTDPFSVHAVIRREDGYYNHLTYDTSEPWELLSRMNRSPWRTDFENMPKDGSIFWSVVSGFVETIWFEDGCFKYHAMGRYIVVADEEILCWVPIPDFSMFLEDEAEAGERKVVYGGRLAGGMSIGLSGLNSAAKKAKAGEG